MNEAEEKRMLDAFEESGGGCREYQVDADDPMVQHELTVWRAAWKAALAYQDELVMAAYADAAKVCSNADIVDAADSQYAQLGDARETLYSAASDILARAPDYARRMMEQSHERRLR